MTEPLVCVSSMKTTPSFRVSLRTWPPSPFHVPLNFAASCARDRDTPTPSAATAMNIALFTLFLLAVVLLPAESLSHFADADGSFESEAQKRLGRNANSLA